MTHPTPTPHIVRPSSTAADRSRGPGRSPGARSRFGAVAVLVLVLAAPSGAQAHGGIDVAEGGRGGVQIAVQGSEAEADQVDLATTLAGPGTGAGSKVVYWIRPSGRTRSVRIPTDRDESGIHHAEIPTQGRGSWQDWDVAAYVTLNNDKQLRVTNDRTDPPGPTANASERPTTPTTTTTTAAPTETTSPPTAASAVDDVSGQGDGAPAWVVPSFVVVLLVAGAAIALGRRRRRTTPED